MDEAGVIAKFGVPPASIPDYLALVGDSADGYPGPAGMGCEVGSGGAGEVRPSRIDSRGLAHVERERPQPRHPRAHADGARELVLLFRRLATLRTDIPVFDSVDELKWGGPTASFPALATRFDAAVTAEARQKGPRPR